MTYLNLFTRNIMCPPHIVCSSVLCLIQGWSAPFILRVFRAVELNPSGDWAIRPAEQQAILGRWRISLDSGLRQNFVKFISYTQHQNFILQQNIVIGGSKTIFSAKFVGLFITCLHAQFNVPRLNQSACIKYYSSTFLFFIIVLCKSVYADNIRLAVVWL